MDVSEHHSARRWMQGLRNGFWWKGYLSPDEYRSHIGHIGIMPVTSFPLAEVIKQLGVSYFMNVLS